MSMTYIGKIINVQSGRYLGTVYKRLICVFLCHFSGAVETKSRLRLGDVSIGIRDRRPRMTMVFDAVEILAVALCPV
jgi:hypothetical protein